MNGKLYRPAQNNASKQYGYGIKVNEIVTMNESVYEEKKVSSITPESAGNLRAMHILNFSENIVVIDGVLS